MVGERWERRHSIQGLFVGHDHCNDFVVEFEGITMAYGRKTGVGGYGPSAK